MRVQYALSRCTAAAGRDEADIYLLCIVIIGSLSKKPELAYG